MSDRANRPLSLRWLQTGAALASILFAVPALAVDSDGDGLEDVDELIIHNTNPRKADTDGDGLNDGDEIANGLNPLDPNDCPIDLCPQSSNVLKSILATAIPPFVFADDVLVIEPGVTPRFRVLNALGRQVPYGLVDAVVDTWKCNPGCNAGSIAVNSDGSITQTSPFDGSQMAYRIRATVGNHPVPSMVMVLSYVDDKDRVLLNTEHWRIAIPVDWIDRIHRRAPDFEAAMDVGWEAQKEAMGKTNEEFWLEDHPGELLPVSSITDDPEVCGLAETPLEFGEACFVNGVTDDSGLIDDPVWFVIFHEMGHLSSNPWGVGGPRSMYDPVLTIVGDGRSRLVESDASILSLWSMHRMFESSTLSQLTRESVGRQLAHMRVLMTNDITSWEADNSIYTEDLFGPGMWNGIHIDLVDEYGWDFILRYVRAWRWDDTILALLGVNPQDVWSTPTTAQERATFAAAAISAAVQVDLRTRFVNQWRLPIDDALFTALFDRFMDTMNQPWSS